MQLTALTQLPDVYRLDGGETVGYLIVRGDRSLLIDCPRGDLPAALAAAGLPTPACVLHTQVQAEHCGECESLPTAAVVVPASAVEVARRSTAFELGLKTFWPPDRYWGNLGEEEFGVGGCPTERPPARPLNVTDLLTPGTTYIWEDVELEVLALPGHGKRSVGLWWPATQTLFSGDLMQAGGFLVNFYDVERCYGNPKGYAELRESLATAEALGATRWLPTTGAPIDSPAADLEAMRERLAWVNRPPRRRQGETAAITNFTPLREFGRYREVLPGCYQNTNFGNVVLFVRPDGTGLMVDPDFCVWESWEENVKEWHADLDLLQAETGLKTVEWALLTHYHGDHVQYCGELRRRYGSTIMSTSDVADVCERPDDFRYPCAVDWYNFPFDHVTVDRRIAYERTFHWHEMPITPIHTPGHCNAHASFLVEWAGHRVLVGGDVIQYGQGTIGCALPIMYNDNAWPDRGLMATLARIQDRDVEYLLGGHSHAFHDPDGAILADMAAVADEALQLARRMVPDGDTLRAMTPPHYDAIRPPADGALRPESQ